MHDNTKLFLNRFEHLLCDIEDFSFYVQPDGCYSVIMDKYANKQHNSIVCKQLIDDMCIALVDPKKEIIFNTDMYFLNIESWQNIFFAMDMPIDDIERLIEIFVPSFNLYTAVIAARETPYLLPKIIDVYLQKGGYFPYHYFFELSYSLLANNVDAPLTKELVNSTVKFLQHHCVLFDNKDNSQSYIFNRLRNVLPEQYWKQLLVAFPEVKTVQENFAPLFVHQSMYMEILHINYSIVSNEFPRFMLPEDIDEAIKFFNLYIANTVDNVWNIKKFNKMQHGCIEIISEKAIDINTIIRGIYNFFKDCAELEISDYIYMISNNGNFSFLQASLTKSILESSLENKKNIKSDRIKI